MTPQIHSPTTLPLSQLPGTWDSHKKVFSEYFTENSVSSTNSKAPIKGCTSNSLLVEKMIQSAKYTTTSSG